MTVSAASVVDGLSGIGLALIGIGLVAVLLLIPWLIGVFARLDGLKPPSRAGRFGVCLLVTIVILVGLVVTLLLAVYLVIALEHIASIGPEGGGFVFLGVFSAGCIGLVVATFYILKSCFSKRGLRTRRVIEATILLCCASACIAGGWLMNLQRMKAIHVRAVDRTRLNGIGIAMALYHEEHHTFPDDLRRLVDDGQPPNIFLSPCSSTREPKPITRPYDGPVDFQYIRLPEDCPLDLVWVWEPPEFHDWEGTHVLFSDHKVRWISPDELLSELTRTYQWLLEHRTRPAAQPAKTGETEAATDK